LNDITKFLNNSSNPIKKTQNKEQIALKINEKNTF
jgi:hypothetical protein